MAENCCREDIQILSDELNSLLLISKQLKTEYQTLLIQNLQKDVRIMELNEKVNAEKYHRVNSVTSPSAMNSIKFLSDAQKDDAKFIYLILNDMFGQSLKNKTLSGRRKKSAIKCSEISHKTKSILEECLEERLISASAEEKQKRLSSLNKLIRMAIDKSVRGK